MRKRKGAQEPVAAFDEKKYSHLLNASRDTLISEFLSRNQEFRQDYSDLASSPKKSPELLQAFYAKWGIGGLKKRPQVKTPERIDVKLRRPVKSLAFVMPEYEEVRRKDPALILAINRIALPKERQYFRDLARTTRLMPVKDSSFARYEKLLPKKYQGSIHFIEPPKRNGASMGIMTWLAGASANGLRYGSDRIILSVSATGSIKNLRKEIEGHLSQHKKLQKLCHYETTWTNYLKVYDLKIAGMTHPEIADTLKIPGNNGARQSGEWYGKCKNLIETGYRRFL